MGVYCNYIELYKHKYMKCYKDDVLDVEISVLDVSNLILDYNQIGKFISKNKFDRLVRLKNESDKKLLFGAEILLHDGCNKYKVDYNAKKYDQYGKPYIEGSNINFNVSHSGKYALCCFSKNNIGCDIEFIGEAYMDVAQRFYNKEEVLQLVNITDKKDRNRLFYDLWVLKESFVKCLGKGLSIGLSDYYFTVVGNNYYRVKQNINSSKYECRLFDIDDTYSIAVCLSIK